MQNVKGRGRSILILTSKRKCQNIIRFARTEKEARLKAETVRINRERKEQKKAEKERKRKEYEARIARQKRNKKQQEKDTDKDGKAGENDNSMSYIVY